MPCGTPSRPGGIAAFNLYLTTTFDPLLERALNAVRFDRAESTRTQAFFPGAANKDLPALAWEENLLDFLCEPPRHLSTDVMKYLGNDLKSHPLFVPVKERMENKSRRGIYATSRSWPCCCSCSFGILGRAASPSTSYDNSPIMNDNLFYDHPFCWTL